MNNIYSSIKILFKTKQAVTVFVRLLSYKSLHKKIGVKNGDLD